MWKCATIYLTFLLFQSSYCVESSAEYYVPDIPNYIPDIANITYQALQDQVDDLQTQIYILSGVFGGVCFILICMVAVQCSSLQSIKQSKKTAPPSALGTLPTSAKTNPAFSGTSAQDVDELSVRGFSQYPTGDASLAQPVQDRFRNPRYYEERKPAADTSVDSRYGQVNRNNSISDRKSYQTRDNQPARENNQPRAGPSRTAAPYENSYGYY